MRKLFIFLTFNAGVFWEDHTDSWGHFKLKFARGEQSIQSSQPKYDFTSNVLLQVADLNSLLKSKLNISDAPVMMAGAAAPAPAAAAPVEVCCYAWYLTPAELRALLCLVFCMSKGYRKFQFLKPQGQV